MKLYLIIIFLLPTFIFANQSLFIGNINFKGQGEGTRFSGSNFKINFQDAEFKIESHEKKGQKFNIKSSNYSITDMVFSPNHNVVAATMSNSEWKKTQMSLVTVDAGGEQKLFEYQSHKMTKRYGWIVELGAVSDDGEFVLAKCALMLEPQNGVRFVRHEWVVLSICDGLIKVIDSEGAIDNWNRNTQCKLP